MNWTIAVILRVGPCPLLICSRFWGDKAARSAAGSAAGSAGRSTACLAGGSWVAGWLGARGWSEYQQVRTSADVMQHASWFFQDRNSWLHMMSWLKPGWTNMYIYIYIYTHIFFFIVSPLPNSWWFVMAILRIYYYNRGTGQSSWTIPTAWQAFNEGLVSELKVEMGCSPKRFQSQLSTANFASLSSISIHNLSNITGF